MHAQEIEDSSSKLHHTLGFDENGQNFFASRKVRDIKKSMS